MRPTFEIPLVADEGDVLERLRARLPAGTTVLEIGTGPGKDLDMLLETFEAVGSDYSQVFLDRYRARRADACPE